MKKNFVSAAFPDFDDTLPEIEGFEDNSYKNDTCPNLLDKERQLKLYIDYRDPANSEHEKNRRSGALLRYQLLSTDAEGQTLGTIAEVDSLEEVLDLIAEHDANAKPQAASGGPRP